MYGSILYQNGQCDHNTSWYMTSNSRSNETQGQRSSTQYYTSQLHTWMKRNNNASSKVTTNCRNVGQRSSWVNAKPVIHLANVNQTVPLFRTQKKILVTISQDERQEVQPKKLSYTSQQFFQLKKCSRISNFQSKFSAVPVKSKSKLFILYHSTMYMWKNSKNKNT